SIMRPSLFSLLFVFLLSLSLVHSFDYYGSRAFGEMDKRNPSMGMRNMGAQQENMAGFLNQFKPSFGKRSRLASFYPDM
ncbi:hypothetical protein PFISCL1PPCAC_14831, partial [Pristionchus fissidentatus]